MKEHLNTLILAVAILLTTLNQRGGIARTASSGLLGT
jgi:hypothetical protein